MGFMLSVITYLFSSQYSIASCSTEKTRQQTQNGVFQAKPHVIKPRHYYNFCSPRNAILIQSVKNHMIKTNQLIYLVDPCYPLKEINIAITNPLLYQYYFLIPAPHCLQKSSFLYISSELLSVCQIGCYLIQINFCSNILLKFLICLSLSFDSRYTFHGM